MSLPCPARPCPGILNLDTDRSLIGVVVESCDTCTYRNRITPFVRAVTPPTTAIAVCVRCADEFEYAVVPGAERKQAPRLCPARCQKKYVYPRRDRRRPTVAAA